MNLTNCLPLGFDSGFRAGSDAFGLGLQRVSEPKGCKWLHRVEYGFNARSVEILSNE